LRPVNQHSLDADGPCSKQDANKAKIRHGITKRRGVLSDINPVYSYINEGKYLAQMENAAKLLK